MNNKRCIVLVFLIVFLAFCSQPILKVHFCLHISSLNGGPGKKYIEHDFTNVEKLLGSDNGMALMMEANNNSVKVGQELKKWIDSLAIQFYTVQDTCYYIPLINNFSFIKSSFCLTQFLDSCTEVYWSSRYPDPKSSIGKIDLKTGRLER